MTAAHTIGSAVFEIKLDPALLPWPDLATDIEAQLLPAVEMVLDATGGEFTLDTLRIDIGVTRFNGSWCGLRERLSEALHDALKRHRRMVAAARPVAASHADLVQPDLEVPEDLALAAKTVDRESAADERPRGRLPECDHSGSDPTAELGRHAGRLGCMPLQRLVVEPRAGVLPAAGLAERLDSADAPIAAPGNGSAEDGTERSIGAKTLAGPRHEPGPHSALIARPAGAGLPRVTPPGLGADLVASRLAEAAAPSPWTTSLPLKGSSEAPAASTSASQIAACSDTAAAAAFASKTPPASGINAEGFAAEFDICQRALVHGPLERRRSQENSGEASEAPIQHHERGPDEALSLVRKAFELTRRMNRHFDAPSARPMSTRHPGVAIGEDVNLETLRKRPASPGMPPPAEALGEVFPTPSAGDHGRRNRSTAADGHFAADSGSTHPPGLHSPPPPAAIEESRRERLALMLAEGALAPEALAVLLDAPALAAVVDHLLAATEAAAPGADTATFRMAMDRHHAAARDQRGFLAGIAVALARGRRYRSRGACGGDHQAA